MPLRLSDFPARRATIWLLSAFCLALAIQSHDGRYSPAGMVFLTLAIVGALGGTYGARFLDWLPDTAPVLNLIIAAGVLAAQFLSPASGYSPATNSLTFLLVVGLVATALWPSQSAIPIRRDLFVALLVCQGAIWIFFLQGIHLQEQNTAKFPFHVRNDVQIFAIESSRLLSEGKNPYSIRMPNVMGRDMPFYSEGATGPDGKLSFGYPYLPLSALLSLPGYWMGDFRFSFAILLLGTAWLLATARPSPTSYLAATFLLLFPSSLFLLSMSWIEPVAVFFLAATVWCYYRAPKWLFLALGCLVASKQYTFFMLALLPLLVPEKENWRPLLWKSIAVALVISVPMAFWDVSGFYRSVVEIQFKQPFREDSLSYLVTLLRASGHKLSPLFGFLALLAGLFFGIKKLPQSPSLWCAAGAVAYLGFFALNKQAFANYYFWPFSLLVTAVAIALPAQSEQTAANLAGES